LHRRDVIHPVLPNVAAPDRVLAVYGADVSSIDESERISIWQWTIKPIPNADVAM
jgi:hypothetical protein